ncbi:MAG: CotH kinase family protein [Acholeplasmataceae bacterium]|jgi:hypothetical protein|nr:CotH kinase family protein [Acholeplasmataceae bacterium]
MKKAILLFIITSISFFFVFIKQTPTIYAERDSLNPSLSHRGGFYTEGFYLTITAKENTTIYYTLDGTTPSNQSLKYNEPLWLEEQWIEADGSEIVITKGMTSIDFPLSMIRTSDKYWISPKEDIFKATVIKILAIDDDTQEQSDIITETFFISEDMMTRYTFPIMSISTDPSHFYDFEDGLNIPGSHYEVLEDDTTSNRTGNYFQTGDDWERPVYVELYETSGILAMAQHAGIRIHGGLSRKYPIKSYRLYARSAYDEQNEFNYQFFKDKDINTFKKVILRNGGQSYQYTFMGEAFAQSLLKPLDLDIQYSAPIILFINGEYFGIRNIRDRFDTDYLETHYGVDEHVSTILTGHAYMEDGSRRGQIHYQQLYNYVTLRDISSLKDYKKIERWMDIDNYIDYMIAELYMGNVDWPQNNIFYWRKNTSYNPNAPYGHDGRWRWMINDLDASFGISWGTIKPDVDPFSRLTGDSWKTGKLFTNLLENDVFKAKFIYRLLELTQTIFDEDVVVSKLDDMTSLYAPEMAEHIARFGYPATYDTWVIYTNRMRDFALERNAYLISYLEDYLSLTEKHQIEISSEPTQGSIIINGINDSSGQYEGLFYDDIQVQIEAVPKDGYYFDGWYDQDLLLSSEEKIYISPELSLDLEARFLSGEKPIDQSPVPYLALTIVASVLTLGHIAFAIVLFKRKR